MKLIKLGRPESCNGPCENWPNILMVRLGCVALNLDRRIRRYALIAGSNRAYLEVELKGYMNIVNLPTNENEN